VRPRYFAEADGWIWSRRERRRLARAGAAPGRRCATASVPLRKPMFHGLTLTSIEQIAILSVPGLRPADVTFGDSEPGTFVVRLRGASAAVVEATRVALVPHVPPGVTLDVRAVEVAL
jgi:hypothetical protein